MSKVDKVRVATTISALGGLALLLFAGALLFAAPLDFEEEVSSRARKLWVGETRTTLGAATANGTTTITVASVTGFAVGNSIEIDVDPNKEAVQITAISGTTITVSPALAKAHAISAKVIVTKVFATTTLSAAAAVGATSITVASNPGGGIKVGSDITIDLGSTAGLEEPGQVKAIAAVAGGRRLTGGFTVTLQNALTKAHAAGAVVGIQDQSIWEQMKKQSSSGSLGSLRSSESSAGSLDSSQSLKSMESGSLKNDILGTEATLGSAETIITNAVSLILMLCFAAIYQKKAVEPVGILPEQGRQYDSGEDFQYGVCDCWKDAHMCCMVFCCSSVRIAHTNAVTDVCGFWPTLFGLCCTSLICGPIGPCCLNVWFRIHLKDHMGLEDHCLNDMLLTWCCFPCMVGQQALSVDEKMGYVFRCPCTMERGGSGFGGYGETQALYG